MNDQLKFKSVFVFTRSEIRGLIVLLMLIIILIGVRFYIHRSTPDFTIERFDAGMTDEINDSIHSFSHSWQNNWNVQEKGIISENTVKIDPNTAQFKELVKAGIPAQVAKNIIAYRSKGGRFLTPDDLLKIYGVDSALFKRIQGILETSSIKHNAEEIPGRKKQLNTIMIELNHSDTAGLKRLPGIGSVLSARIIRFRNALGGFYSPHQLTEVYGISDSLYRIIARNVEVDTMLIRKINLNSASADDLKKHPYLEPFQVKAILSYRRLAGPFTRIEELTENYLIPVENFKKLRPYLEIKQ
jgi:competence protein ComEA